MTDFSRRNTLKTLSAASVIAAAPVVASAASASAKSLSKTSSTDSALSISFDYSDYSTTQVVTVTNASTQAASMQHVSPGLVKSGGYVFDINDLMVDGPLTLDAGETKAFAISPLPAGAIERRNPGGTIANQTLTVSTRYDAFGGHRSVSTKRLCMT